MLGTGTEPYQITFTDGSVQKYATESSAFKTYDFAPGEEINGDLTICGDGRGAGTGCFAFNDFQVGETFYDRGEDNSPRTQFKFDAKDRVLTGIAVFHAGDINAIGPVLSKKIEGSVVTDVVYEGFNSNEEVPLAGIRSSTEVSYTNDLSSDGFFELTYDVFEIIDPLFFVISNKVHQRWT